MKKIYIFKKWKDGYLYPIQQTNAEQLMSFWNNQLFFENLETIKSLVKMNFLWENDKIDEKDFDENYKILFDF